MAYSYIRYTGNGTQTDFTFAFPYFSTANISVTVDGTAAPFTWVNSSTVKITTAPALGAVIFIQRTTPKDITPVNFVDGSVLLEADLDTLALFSLYAAQESIDEAQKSIQLNLSGNWEAQNQRIVNLADPVNAQDAVTKNYFESVYTPQLDAKVSAATAQAGIATTKASEASSSAASALSSKNSAETAKIAAELAETNAETAETNAETAQAAAVVAKVAAELAETNAETAQAAASSSAATATTQAGISTTQAGIATTQAGISTAQATIATTKAAEAVVSASDSAASAVSAASSAASAAALLDNFDDRYLGSKTSAPTLDNDGNALLVGALYFDSTAGKMRVYTASGWLDASSASVATLAVFNYTATAGQTSFSGADIASQTLTYTVGSLFVTLNGIDLKNGTDYTATTGSSIVLTAGAVAGDELRVYAFGSFLVADTYTRAQADAGFVAKDGSGNVGIGTSSPGYKLSIQAAVGGGFNMTNGVDSTLRVLLPTTGITYDNVNGGYHAWQVSGTERMRIDSSGRVTLPNQPSFIAYMSGSNLSKSNLTEPIPYNATQVNIGSHFNTSTYKFTAPVAGRYFFHAIVNVYSLGAGASLYCGFYKNGTQQALGTYNPSHSSSDQNIESSIMLNLAAGDYVHVYVYGAGSYGMSASGDVNANWQRFEGYLVG